MCCCGFAQAVCFGALNAAMMKGRMERRRWWCEEEQIWWLLVRHAPGLLENGHLRRERVEKKGKYE